MRQDARAIALDDARRRVAVLASRESIEAMTLRQTRRLLTTARQNLREAERLARMEQGELAVG